MQQIWMDIKNYQGKYQVSNLGRVRALNYHRQKQIRLLKVHKLRVVNKNRVYIKHRIELCKNGKLKSLNLPRLVYETFKNKIPNGYQVDHINNNPEDNRLQNLQLLTPSENMKKVYIDNPNYKNNGGSKPQKVICIDTGVVYNSIRQCSNKLNLKFSNLRAVLKGKYKQTHGYKFQYLFDENTTNNNSLIQMELF